MRIPALTGLSVILIATSLTGCAAGPSADYVAYLGAVAAQRGAAQQPASDITVDDSGRLKSVKTYAPAQPVHIQPPTDATGVWWDRALRLVGIVLPEARAMVGANESRKQWTGIISSITANGGTHVSAGGDIADSLSGDHTHAPVTTTTTTSTETPAATP